MTPMSLFAFLLIQSCLVHCQEGNEVITPPPEIDVLPLTIARNEDNLEVDQAAKDDFFSKMFGAYGNFYPTSSVSLMNHITNSDKSPEEQIKDIKDIASKISMAIQNEMVNLMSFAMGNGEKSFSNNEKRKKRSVETPMDSTELVMRLLRHIKNNNEYQNIAIEKMMSAQEIANKFGIDFTPDTETLSDLAVAANDQAKEMSEILRDACSTRNKTENILFVPFDDDEAPVEVESITDNDDNYYVYAVYQPEEKPLARLNSTPIQEYEPEQIHRKPKNSQVHQLHPHQHHQHFETQIVAPPVHDHNVNMHSARSGLIHQYPIQSNHQNHISPPVCTRPNFYEIPTVLSVSVPEFQPQVCAPYEPVPAAFIALEEVIEPEPELVGEEYEETVTSKISVDHNDGPGSATVNHVMTYTVSEKSHFKKPQIANLPQQMQYSFFLM